MRAIRRPLVATTLLLTLGAASSPALAQSTGDRRADRVDRQERPERGVRAPQADRPDRPARPSAERQKAAWEAQARTVATAIGADVATTGAVIEAWIMSREELRDRQQRQAEDRRASRGETDRGPRGGVRDGRRDRARTDRRERDEQATRVREQAMQQLKTRLGGVLDEAQVEKAMAAFGVPVAVWDRATLGVLQMRLDAKPQATVMAAVHEYLAEAGRIRRAAREEGGRAQAREAMESAVAKLEQSLGQTLEDAQVQRMVTVLRGQRRGRGAQEPAGRAGRGSRPDGAGPGAAPRRGAGAGGGTGAGRGGRGG